MFLPASFKLEIAMLISFGIGFIIGVMFTAYLMNGTVYKLENKVREYKKQMAEMQASANHWKTLAINRYTTPDAKPIFNQLTKDE